MTHRRRLSRILVVVAALAALSAAVPARPAAADTPVGLDGFGRTVANGLGSADTGGAWTLAGTASSFSVGSGVASLTLQPGRTLSAYLTATPTQDTDVTTSVRFSAPAVGGPVYPGVVGRRVGTHDYSTTAVVSPNGSARLNIGRDGTTISTSPTLGFTVAAGATVRLRMQTVGSGTTALRARAWLDGTTEPTAWQVSTTDATAANQGAGAFGFRAYLSSGTTNAPIVYRFDDFAATAPGGAPSRPTQEQWLADVATAMDGGTAYLDSQTGVTRPAIVLDIDNTSLQSYYQPFAATPPVLSFAQRAVADGYAVLFATGRGADTGGTQRQLQNAGYRVDALCFRDPNVSVQASKTNCRASWVAAGYTIVANAGNRTTDLDGGNSGRQYLLPNYGFLD